MILWTCYLFVGCLFYAIFFFGCQEVHGEGDMQAHVVMLFVLLLFWPLLLVAIIMLLLMGWRP